VFSKIIEPGVEIRLVEDRHALEVYSVVDAHRRYLREWLPWVDATGSAESTREWIRMSLEQFAAGNGFQAGVWVDGAFSGSVGFQPIQWMSRRAEIGYWLAPNVQGRGIVSKAVWAMTTHAFEELSLNRVQIQCAVGNKRSQAIPRRLGFVEEAITAQGQLLHGVYHDLMMFRMLRPEWAQIAAKGAVPR
jgi:ribosomal-protein-serine acetyltransferase